MNHQDTKTPRTAISSRTDEMARQVVDAAYQVHRTLVPGLLESVYEICLVHEAQLLTYLKLSGRRLGLLINFNVARIKDGIRRMAL
jgi:hypothetical protein